MAGALKVILGGLGGALQGARSDSKTDLGESMSKLGDVAKKKKPTPDADPVKPEPVVEEKPVEEEGSDLGEKIEEKKESEVTNTDTAKATGNSTISDEDLKNIYGEAIDDKLIENFAKISAIDFKYNQEAQNEYQNKLNVDDKEHIGVIAQELQNNEATKGTVEQTENGDLAVNTDQLTMADTAAIAELSRRVLALEEAVKSLQQ